MSDPQAADPAALQAMAQLFGHHPRQWRDLTYVYPVISRRSRGLSIGVNVNPDKLCNFDCVYCCVDRTHTPPRSEVDLDQIAAELDQVLAVAQSGEMWQDTEFADTAPAYRQIADIAFSGDGEPTTFARLGDAVRVAAWVKRARGLASVPLVLITNASLLDRPNVMQALSVLDHEGGEVWAKLDAGTEELYQHINRTSVPFEVVLRNVLHCGRVRPIVIQTLLLQLGDQPISDEQFDAYVNRVGDLALQGCQIKRVQLYTIARRPALSLARPLTDEHMDHFAARLRSRLPAHEVEVFYGVDA